MNIYAVLFFSNFFFVFFLGEQRLNASFLGGSSDDGTNSDFYDPRQSPPKAIVDSSPLQPQMDKNKECKWNDNFFQNLFLRICFCKHVHSSYLPRDFIIVIHTHSRYSLICPVCHFWLLKREERKLLSLSTPKYFLFKAFIIYLIYSFGYLMLFCWFSFLERLSAISKVWRERFFSFCFLSYFFFFYKSLYIL